MACEYIRGLLIRSLRRCLKLQREYSIELTPNPATDSLGRWQVSMFVDASTEVGHLVEVSDRMLDLANGKPCKGYCRAMASAEEG